MAVGAYGPGDDDDDGGADEGGGPLPPRGFDPLRASQEELAHFGLPPRPDPEAQPLLFRAFATVFSPPLLFVDPVVQELAFIGQQTPQPVTPVGTPSLTELSANWSGAYIEANSGRQFVMVVGRWQVPTLALPPPIDRVPPASGAIYDCSTWIGLDGQRLYLDASLPQVGTEQSLPAAGGPTAARAWFQWWARGETKLHRRFLDGVPLTPGDDVRCMLWVKHPQRVHAFLHNASTGAIAKVHARAPEVMLPDGTLTRPSVAGATAEWITERPAVPPPPGEPAPSHPPLFAFPDYGTTVFHDCIAGLAPQPGPAQSAADLTGQRLIRLVETRHAPERIATLSTPTRIDATRLRTRYGGFV